MGRLPRGVPAESSAQKTAAAKFKDPLVTADGEPRASVPLGALEILWLNTGTLCNVTCRHCYIESSPRNDRLVYLSPDDVSPYLDEIAALGLGTREIGFTGGEPFMNPYIAELLCMCLERGFGVLVLTNAMRPMQRHKTRLLWLKERYGKQLRLRVSLDHYTAARHEEERGARTFAPGVAGLVWLAKNGFEISIAGRSMWGESEAAMRLGFAELLAELGIGLDTGDPAALVLFPEMDERADVPEITTACWGILGKSPADVMCATSRMVVKRKGAERASVVSCTLLPYDPQFELGATLKAAQVAVP
ncbi:MAG: radical SAM protein, partial [Hyphomicrobiaceae bacterium]